MKMKIIIGCLSVVVIYGGIFFWRRSHVIVTEQQKDSSIDSKVENFATSSNLLIKQEPTFGEFLHDQDRDGILDEKEKELGLSDQTSDTDKDGLDDNTEINVYKTDPKNKDTDGDGYVDGYEVLNGFNPNGPGKLKQ